MPLIVTTIADAYPLSAAGPLSLRAAIETAGSYPGDHVITFAIPTSDAGYDSTAHAYTITLDPALGPLDLSNPAGSITLQGLGAGRR